jgi:hypothetical protein
MDLFSWYEFWLRWGVFKARDAGECDAFVSPIRSIAERQYFAFFVAKELARVENDWANGKAL